MAYNYNPSYNPSYYPNYFTNYTQQPAQVSLTPQTNSNSLIWVQGESGAKSYLVAPNTTVLLMDSESDRFFIKSADSSGMPMPLRIFTYTENTNNEPVNEVGAKNTSVVDYATKTELGEITKQIEALQDKVEHISASASYPINKFKKSKREDEDDE